MDWVAILGFGALSVLALAGSLLSWRRGAPATLEQRVDGLTDHVEKLYAEWAAARLGFEKLREELLDLAESVETKRKRVAARTSREKKSDPETMDPQSQEYRDHLLRQARAQGHPV